MVVVVEQLFNLENKKWYNLFVFVRGGIGEVIIVQVNFVSVRMVVKVNGNYCVFYVLE